MLDLNGVVVSWNAGAQRIKGYAADEVIGTHFSRFYTESDRLAGIPGRALQAALEHGKYTAEGWRVRKDGSLLWASVVLEAIRDESGAIIGFAKMTRDISDRRRAREALEAAQAQLLRSQKMDSLGKLTAGLAHDFNNLLMIVGAQAQALVKRPLDESRVTRAVAAIKFAVDRGARITRQLLAFARQQPLNPTSIDLGARVDALRDLLSSSAGALVHLELAFAPDLWPVEADVNELELALVNLTINARDAMPAGGEIKLSAENVVLQKSGPTGDLEGAFVALTVADTGVGIPEDILPKIFDPFFTTKDVDKGTGLGLSQVYGFAQQSRGTVTVASTVGAGTRMTLYLPRSRPVEESTVSDGDTVIEGSEGTVLVIDDNPEVALASAGLVEELGYKTVLAASAESALKILAENKDISLVFSDIIMPGSMDGLGLARTVRERYPDLPILLTTGFSPASQGSGEFPILRKPYALSDLARAVAIATKKKALAGDDKLIDLGAVRRGRGSPK
jgi:PAS domain S-box-containing protein